MSVYFKTDKDKINYVRVLLHIMYADRNVDDRELEHLYTMIYMHDISESLYFEAEDLYDEYKVKDCEFSCNEAAIQALVDASELMASDLNMDLLEIARIISLAKKFGVYGGQNIHDNLLSYIKKYLDIQKKLDKLFDKVDENAVKFFNLRDSLTTENDRAGFVKLLLYIAYADRDIHDAELNHIGILTKLYGIDNTLVNRAFAEFKQNPEDFPRFDNNHGFVSAFREAVKLVSRDNCVLQEEREAVKRLVKEYKIIWGEGYLSIVLDTVESQLACSKLKAECIENWIKKSKEAS